MTTIESLFALDPNRAERYALFAEGLLFDYSKTTLTDTDLDQLLETLAGCHLTEWRDRMFDGDMVNTTENRPVLHTALRDPNGEPLLVSGQNLRPLIKNNLRRMFAFAASLKSGRRQSSSGQPYSHIVNIGIGGSDLGPKLAIAALAPNHDAPRVQFLSNVDGTGFNDCIEKIDPHTTLFIVASKSFGTPETLLNATAARNWLTQQGIRDPAKNFVAVTAASKRAVEFGIDPQSVFPLDDGVGGRYSLWGSIGLPVIIAIGRERFEAMLEGARSMDQHFRSTTPRHNMPILLAIIGIWHARSCGFASRAVVPYENRLSLLPNYLQQLEMESNGKSIARNGSPVIGETVPVIWGTSGTDGQHSYFQMLHQGTRIVPCEFMIGARGASGTLDSHHRVLLANCLAQSEALMTGRDFEATKGILSQSGETPTPDMIRHRTFAGNRPTTTLIYNRLTPYVLGQLLALYEHRTFVEGVFMNINSFDQWGVELGKSLAEALLPAIDTPSAAPPDTTAGTQALLQHIASLRNPHNSEGGIPP